MAAITGGTRLARDQDVEKRHVRVSLSELAYKALASAGDIADPSSKMEGALLCYLGDSDKGRPAWFYPGFLRGSETRGDIEVDLEVASDLWRKFEQEAVRQGVSIEQLVEHATFYFAAELDAGRVTQRILDDLGASEGSSSS
jgi:hypothetical protein